VELKPELLRELIGQLYAREQRTLRAHAESQSARDKSRVGMRRQLIQHSPERKGCGAMLTVFGRREASSCGTVGFLSIAASHAKN
jgi:hypothetical protein